MVGACKVALAVGIVAAALALAVLAVRGERAQDGNASSTSVDTTPAAEPRASDQRAWTPGAQRVYELVSEYDARLSSGPEQRISFSLRGSWTTTVDRVDADGVVVRIALERPALVLAGTADDGGAVAALERQLATPFLVTLDRQGRVVLVHFARDVSQEARAFLRGIVAETQYGTPDDPSAAAWELAEHDSFGGYTGAYRREGARAVEKTKQDYTSLALPLGAQVDDNTRPSLYGSARFELGSDDLVEHVASRAQMKAQWRSGAVDVQFAVRLALRDRRMVSAPGGRLDLAGPLETVDIVSQPYRVDPQSADRGLVAGADYEQLVRSAEEAIAEGDEQGISYHLLRFAAMFRLESESVFQAAKLAIETPVPRLASVITGALGSVGTKAAQQALVDIAETGTTREARVMSLTSLALIDAPDPRTVEALHDLADDADPLVASSATLALGSASSSFSDESADDDGSVDPVAILLDRLARSGSDEETSLYLQALGNTGDDRIVPAVVAALESPGLTVRSAAAMALRSPPSPEVDKALAVLLRTEPSPGVRKNAIFAASRRLTNPDTLAVVAWVADNDPDEHVREEASAVLRTATN